MLTRTTTVDTGHVGFGIVNPPMNLATDDESLKGEVSAMMDFLMAMDEGESLRDEVSALFAEFEDKVPSFWRQELGTNSDSRSAVPVVFALERPGKNFSDTTLPVMMTQQVFGMGAGSEELFSIDENHVEFSRRMVEIVKRFDV